MRKQGEFFKSYILIGSGSGRNFPILPAHDTILLWREGTLDFSS